MTIEIEINYWAGYDVTVYKFGDIPRPNGMGNMLRQTTKSEFSRKLKCIFCNWTTMHISDTVLTYPTLHTHTNTTKCDSGSDKKLTQGIKELTNPSHLSI